jgi:serine/threonine protein kinase
MTALLNYVGQTLDEKYRLERLLGKGGMGAVYLATHLGTERYVALKLIAPQFMRNREFVERFKREAKAAGRLRHPNVVDVTDFGFAKVFDDTVAYLVMEYLDGCTLADVLNEEHKLQLEWVVDILEQVCSAVHEAHQQGIVHRDLKPENIWLEPNRLGGYRVKVLDFGIAKLGQVAGDELETATGPAEVAGESSTKILSAAAITQITGSDARATGVAGNAPTNQTNLFRGSEQETQLYTQPGSDPRKTALHDENETNIPGNGELGAEAPTLITGSARSKAIEADDKTLMFQPASKSFLSLSASETHAERPELTRVGAIMGTPLYMSPEQCAGKTSEARSDIYSLGVIAYQMLSGEPPFTGETAKVMKEHIENSPAPLRERTKVPKRIASVVMSALAKDPSERPQTALAFSNALRAHADGIGALYRRAIALYSEYFPKFLKLSLIAHIPVIITILLMVILQITEQAQPRGLNFGRVAVICGLVIVGLSQVVAYFIASASISGMTAVIVTQVSAAPLRPVELRTPFAVLKRRWRPFLNTSIRVTLRILIGYILLIIPGLIMQIRYSLYAPVTLIEGLQKKAAMQRARELASRSWRTVIVVSLLQIIIPMTVSALIGRLSVKPKAESESGVSVQGVYQQLSGLINIFIVPLISIVPALLYLKMRQLGGETLSSSLAQIEEMDPRHSQWQQRMRSRVSLSSFRSRPSNQ